LDQSCTAHEAENTGAMEQGKEEKRSGSFASNETKMSRGERARASLQPEETKLSQN
jgi:hypothetical protein